MIIKGNSNINGNEVNMMEKTELLKFIGNKIKEYRLKKKFSQADLAKYIGVTNTSVSEYERGRVNIDADTLFQIADVLEAKVDDFFPARRSDSEPIDLMNEFRNINLDAKYLLMFKEMFEKANSMNEEERKKYLESLKLTIEFHDKLRNN